jgi:hypothetical protein
MLAGASPIVAFVADEHDRIPGLGKADGLEVNLGDQWTGGVDGPQPAGGGGGANGRGYTVGAVQHRLSFGDVVDAIDEDDATFAEALDHRAVVDDLVEDVEGRTEQLQGPFQAFDGHVDAGTEAPWIGQDDLHDGSPHPSGRCPPWVNRSPNRQTTGATTAPPERVALAGNGLSAGAVTCRT